MIILPRRRVPRTRPRVRPRAAAVLGPVLLLAACAPAPAPAPSRAWPDLAGSPGTTQPTPARPTGPAGSADPGSAPPTGTAPPGPGTPAGADRPPGAASNNAWKQRRELSAADRAPATRAGDRIRPALERLRTTGDVTPAAARRVLLDLGYPDTDITVQPMRTPSWWTQPQPPAGAVFGVRVGQAACVTGDVRPERVLVEVVGSAAEYGCVEPFAH